ncbi:MAG: hypothetical protein HRU20_07270 [Pseudomonadales bacterium]|nr:hypothetical protein [Pseudomonadales bacterium]
MLIYRVINPVMKSLLNSPFHPVLSRRIMTVSYTGNKSGKAYSTPVSYYREGDKVYCFTNGVWWRNFRTGADVVLRMKGKDYPGHATVNTESEEEKLDTMMAYFKAIPSDGKFYGVSFDANKDPYPDQVKMASKMVVMITTTLK